MSADVCLVSDPSSAPLPWERGDRPALTGSWWARGLWLAERLAATGVPPAAEAGAASTRARRRLERWRTAYPELVGDAVRPWLDAVGVDAELLVDLLAESPDGLAGRAGKPTWAGRVEEIVAGTPAPAPIPVPADASWQTGFVAVVRPFVADAVRRLTDSAEYRRADRVDGTALVAAFADRLGNALANQSNRILVLELNVARVRGRLTGETAAARFWSFVELLRDPAELASLLDEYVVLARALVTTADLAVRAYREFLARFTADRDLVVGRLFDGVDPGALTEATLGGGDPHDRGRSVALLRFASDARLVYKPRPLDLHATFNAITDWYNGLLGDDRLRAVRVVARDGYGWAEFVAAEPCADEAGARRYFRRQGALLALLYVMGAVDFHFENLIAAGDQPVLVDLESVCHVDLPIHSGSELIDGDPAGHALRDSVSRTGLLPTVLIGPDRTVADMGGMGGDAGSTLPYRSLDWSSGGTDTMRVTRVHRTFTGSQNRPTIAGRDLDPGRYRDPLLAGFRLGYRAIAARRGELDGMLDGLADVEGRLIARATRTYMTLIVETTHPDVARDALDRDRILTLLWAQASGDARRSALVGHELVDLWHGDVPLFRSRLGSRDLWSTDRVRIADALPESGLARVRACLDRLDERDLAEQEWIIDASLATRTAGDRRPRGLPDPGAAVEGLPARALAAADAIADRLAATAYRAGGRIGWLGIDLVDDDRWMLAPLHADLYNGYPGVALFLAQLAHLTGDPARAEEARALVATLAAHAAAGADEPAGAARGGMLGAFDGVAGLAYAMDTVAVLLGDDSLAEQVPGLLRRIGDNLGADEGLDVINGAAGCLAVAEALLDRYPSLAGPLAARCVGRLVDTAVPAGAGLGWPGGAGARPLLGFSHGAAGIGWALLRYAARTGDERARSVGTAAMDYEHGEYHDPIGNWPDLRDMPTRPWQRADPATAVPHMFAWCHGAPGVGLARAGVAGPLRTESMDADLRLAVDRTVAAGRAADHSLCHGDLGNLELLRAAADAGVPGAADHHARLAASTVDDIGRQGPRCGTPALVGTPGLMCGLAGIGHGLLRIAAPDRIAPVLLLGAQR